MTITELFHHTNTRPCDIILLFSRFFSLKTDKKEIEDPHLKDDESVVFLIVYVMFTMRLINVTLCISSQQLGSGSRYIAIFLDS